MPINLIFVRHGKSEGNVAGKKSEQGDHSAFTDEYRGRHSSAWRLTDLGISQAEAAGDWLLNNLPPEYFRYYVSTYLRAMETAAHLGLPAADWRMVDFLRERDWGALDVLDNDERWIHHAANLHRRDTDRYHWRAPDGEAMADIVATRTKILFDQLARECSNAQQVVVVCHGEFIAGSMVRLCYWSPEQFNAWDVSDDPHDKIRNGQIIHFSRVHPETGEIGDRLAWWRSICPWDLTLSRNEWQHIVRPRITNEDLLAMVQRHQRLVND